MVTPIGGPSPLPTGGSPFAPFTKELTQLTNGLQTALKDYRSNQASFDHLQATAYNLYCFMQDNHPWLQSNNLPLNRETFDQISNLLSPYTNKSNEQTTATNYQTAIATIRNAVLPHLDH